MKRQLTKQQINKLNKLPVIKTENGTFTVSRKNDRYQLDFAKSGAHTIHLKWVLLLDGENATVIRKKSMEEIMLILFMFPLAVALMAILGLIGLSFTKGAPVPGAIYIFAVVIALLEAFQARVFIKIFNKFPPKELEKFFKQL